MSEANQTPPTTQKNRPVRKLKIGLLSAAIWRHEGKTGPFYSVSFQRGYKPEGAEEWSNSDSFHRGDLLELAKLADQAHTHVLKLEWDDRQNSRKSDDEMPANG
jgi:hypothetical protein